MRLIIIAGQSATGKTTFAVRLAKDLGYTLFLKDEYKEARFDELDKNLKLRNFNAIEKDSWRTMYDKIRVAVATGKPLIVEGNFLPKQRREMRGLLRNDTDVIEVFCYARGLVPFKRYVARSRSGQRHKGHFDRLWYPWVLKDTLLSMIGINIYRPLQLSYAVIRVDTTDFTAVDYKRILRYITDRH